jgi:hypothetical protein
MTSCGVRSARIENRWWICAPVSVAFRTSGALAVLAVVAGAVVVSPAGES